MEKFIVVLTSLFLSVGIIKFFFKGGKNEENSPSEKDFSKKEDTLELNISGMHCAGCAAGIEGTLKAVD